MRLGDAGPITFSRKTDMRRWQFPDFSGTNGVFFTCSSVGNETRAATLVAPHTKT